MVLPGFTYARFDQCERHVQQFGPDLGLSRAALPWNGRAPRRRMTSDRPASPAMSCSRNRSPRSSSRPCSRVPEFRSSHWSGESCYRRVRPWRTADRGLHGGIRTNCRARAKETRRRAPMDGCCDQSLAGAALPGRHDDAERERVGRKRAVRSVRSASGLATQTATCATMESDCACRAMARGPSNRHGATPMRKELLRDTSWCAMVHEDRRTGGDAC